MSSGRGRVGGPGTGAWDRGEHRRGTEPADEVATAGRRGLLVVLCCLAGLLLAVALSAGGAAAAGVHDNGTITGCGTVDESGSYELDGPITNDSGSYCLEVVASNVTIDGNGYAMDGVDDTTGYGIGVVGSSISNVTIRNVTVTTFIHGAYVEDASGVTLRNVTASDNGNDGTYLHGADGSTVLDSTLSANDRHGLRAEDVSTSLVVRNSTASSNGAGGEFLGVYVASSSANVDVTNNTIDSNTGGGIGVFETPGAEIRNNSVSDNGGPGVEVNFGADDATVADNVLSSNVHGIQVGSSSTSGYNSADGVTLSNNTVTDSVEEGVHVLGSANVAVSNNDVTNAGTGSWAQPPFGINATASSGIVVANNTVENTVGGVYLLDSDDGTARDNVITGNDYGLILEDATGTTVAANAITGNAFDGINVFRGSDTVVRNNTATGNGWGLFLVQTENVTASGNDVSANVNGTALDAATNVTMRDTLAANNSEWAMTAFNGSTVASATNYTLAGGAAVNFSAHDARIEGVATPPAGPIDTVQLGPVVNATGANPGAWLNLAVGYDDSTLVTGQNESTARLWRYDGSWSDDVGGANGVDTANDAVTANVSEFGTGTPASTFTLHAAEEPVANVTPTSVDFTTTEIGDTRTAEIILANDGLVPLSIAGFGQSGENVSQFDTTRFLGTVQPGNSTTIPVEFVPDSTGTKEATISIAHNGSDSPVEVSLSGEAVDTEPPALADATAVNATDDSSFVGRNSDVEVSATVTDNHEVESVTVDASALGAGTVTLTNASGSDRYNATFTVDAANATADGDHSLVVNATDHAGNVNLTTAGSITLDTTGPTVTIGTPTEDAALATDDPRFIGNPTDAVAGVDEVEFNYGRGWYPGNSSSDSSWVASPANPPLSDGNYTFRARATDIVGNVGPVATVNVTVDTVAPIAGIVNGNRSVDEDTAVAFDGTNSTDAQGVATYHWNFGDGTTATGATVSHPFEDPGTFTVTLTVRDAAGNENATNVTVTVENVEEDDGDGDGDFFVPPPETTPPTADAGVDRTVTAGTAITLDGRESSDDAGITAFRWDVNGDGVADMTGPSPTHTFEDPGTYEVVLTVSDGNGNTDTDAVTITVDAVSEPGSFDVEITDAATAVVAGESVVLTYAVENAGDETATQDVELVANGTVVATRDGVELAGGETVTRTWNYTTDDAGSRALAVRTADDEATTTLDVLDAPPTELGAVDAPASVAPGEPVEISVEVTNAGDAARAGTVTLSLDGEQVDAASTDLDAGESATVVLEATAPDASGNYTATVGLEGGTVEQTAVVQIDTATSGGGDDGAEESGGGDDGGSDDGTPGFGVIASLVAAVLGTAILRRRRR